MEDEEDDEVRDDDFVCDWAEDEESEDEEEEDEEDDEAREEAFVRDLAFGFALASAGAESFVWLALASGDAFLLCSRGTRRIFAGCENTVV